MLPEKLNAVRPPIRHESRGVLPLPLCGIERVRKLDVEPHSGVPAQATRTRVRADVGTSRQPSLAHASAPPRRCCFPSLIFRPRLPLARSGLLIQVDRTGWRKAKTAFGPSAANVLTTADRTPVDAPCLSPDHNIHCYFPGLRWYTVCVKRSTTAWRLLVASLRTRGLRGTIRRLKRLSAARGEHRRREQADRRFDEVRGVDTGTWVRVPELDAPGPNRDARGSLRAVERRRVRLLMGKLRHVDLATSPSSTTAAVRGACSCLRRSTRSSASSVSSSPSRSNEIARENIATLGADGHPHRDRHRRRDGLRSAARAARPVLLPPVRPDRAPTRARACSRVARERNRDRRTSSIDRPPEACGAPSRSPVSSGSTSTSSVGYTRGVFAAPAALSRTADAGRLGVRRPVRRTRATPSSESSRSPSSGARRGRRPRPGP